MKATIKRRLPGWFALAVVLMLLAAGAEAHSYKQRALKYSSRSQKMALAWQNDTRAKLSALLNIDDLIAARKDIPLNPTEISSVNKVDYLMKEIEISSTQNRRIRVMVTCPMKSRGPWPAVVCLHGHGGQPTSVYEKDSPYNGFATELAIRNYVTVAPVTSQHEIFEQGRTLVGERLWDAMRCIDYLETLISVDALRIGCAGLSMGGEMSMWLGAMDQRVSAVLSAGFLTKMDQMEQDHCVCWKVPGIRELVDFPDIFCLIAPRPLMCQNGLQEPPSQFPVDVAKSALKAIQVIYMNFSQSVRVELIVHPEGHVVDIKSLLLFFRKELKPVEIKAASIR